MSKRRPEDLRVRGVVEQILSAIAARGDTAVRKYSERLDERSLAVFGLSRSDIDACYNELSTQAIDDIWFAQQQVEVETLPSVSLGKAF